MKRTFIVLTIVVLAVLLVATPGLAAGSQNRHGLRGGGGGRGSTSFNLLGTIGAIACPAESDEPYIEVDKSWPSTGVVTVYLDKETLYKQCTGDGPGSSLVISCDALEIGSEVRIVGDRDDWTATRVILYVD